MHSKLVEDTTKQNIIEEVVHFDTSLEGKVWQCPFCHENNGPYQLNVPPSTQVDNWKQTKLLIKNHIELHKKDVLSQMARENQYGQYEKARADSSKRVRLWITGTINDRKLYEEDPL